LPVTAKEDIAGFDISVDDLFAVEVGESVENSFGDFAQDFFPGTASEFFHFAVDGVEGTAFAEFHGDADGGC